MPNDSVFDTGVQPIFTQMTNTYQTPGTIAPPDANAALTGNEYNATATNSASLGVIGGSVIITLQISNPLGSGKTLYISRITGGSGVSLSLLSSFTATLTFTKGGTITTPTTVTPVNGNFSSANTSLMTTRSSTAVVTGGTAFMSLPLIAGQVVLEQTGRLVIPPNQSLTVTISAALTVLGVLSTTVNLTWWEG